MKKMISFILIAAFIITAFTGCGSQNGGTLQNGNSPANGDSPAETHSGGTSGETSAQQAQPDDGWEGLFTYDEANAVQFSVKAAIPGEEETYEYPWGEYDAPVDVPEGSEAPPDAGSSGKLDAGEINQQLQEALKDLSPEQRKIAEEAMEKARKQGQDAMDSQAEPAQGEEASEEGRELPPDWNDGSNQPALGGRLELVNGDTTVIIEMSEYCVDADTTFTVTPIKASGLPEEFLKSGFTLSGSGGEGHVTLKDYAVVTFLTREDPGEEVVLRSLGGDGDVEYAPAEVTKLGGTYRITGAVEHFSTVGYGAAELSPEAEAAMERINRNLAERERLMRDKARLEKKWAELYENKKHVETIEFDEILFTSTIRGDPCQLHLRAKLVQQPYKVNTAIQDVDSVFVGKVWLKAYIQSPGAGYGEVYYLCNNATLEDPVFWKPSTAGQGPNSATATFGMTTIGGSKAVGYDVGTFDVSGKTYSSLKSVWEWNESSGAVKVTFTSAVGFTNKTFVTGRLSAKTKKQAAKKLKWFLD
jgi:hypothetical protein